MGISYFTKGEFAMIDTIKIYAEIDVNTYNKIKSMSIVKSSIDNMTQQKQYEIINDHLEGSFDSRLSVKVDCGAKYQLSNLGYCIEIEGSYHKIIRGFNSHNGFYDLEFISKSLIQFVELSYNIELPEYKNWFIHRVDIAVCYDLKTQGNVINYINSLSRCNYPRRKIKFFNDESLYLSGTTTTLKIYNKLLEFKKHDIKKFNNTNFNLLEYLEKIKGFVRFECEIKKKTLLKITNSTKHINIMNVNYEILKSVWSEEFMKLLQFIKKDLDVVRKREDVLKRLNDVYKPAKAHLLFNFYCAIQLNGVTDIKKEYSSTTYYRYTKELKQAKIDFSQSYKIEECDIYYFNPFEAEEVA